MAARMLDGVKAQARVPIPVVRALEKELGVEKAHALVWSAIAESWPGYMASRSGGASDYPGEASGGLDFPVESEIVPFCDFRWRRKP